MYFYRGFKSNSWTQLLISSDPILISQQTNPPEKQNKSQSTSLHNPPEDLIESAVNPTSHRVYQPHPQEPPHSNTSLLRRITSCFS